MESFGNPRSWMHSRPCAVCVCSFSRWLIVSPKEVVCEDLCASVHTAQRSVRSVRSMSVTLPPAGVAYRPCARAELVATSIDQLQLLMACLACEHTLLVLPPLSDPLPEEDDDDDDDDQEPVLAAHMPGHANGGAGSNGAHLGAESSDEDHEGAGMQDWEAQRRHWRRVAAARKATSMRGSMLAAFQAHSRVRHASRLSLITFAPVQPDAAGFARREAELSVAASMALSRTLFMEARAARGPAIAIWPPDKPPSAKVCQHSVAAKQVSAVDHYAQALAWACCRCCNASWRVEQSTTLRCRAVACMQRG